MSDPKNKNKAPMPASSAGLLRFFEDETSGIKIQPQLVVGLAVGLVIVTILLRLVISA